MFSFDINFYVGQSLVKNTESWAECIAQVVEHLLSRCRALRLKKKK
jgi:hypothetical protein